MNMANKKTTFRSVGAFFAYLWMGTSFVAIVPASAFLLLGLDEIVWKFTTAVVAVVEVSLLVRLLLVGVTVKPESVVVRNIWRTHHVKAPATVAMTTDASLLGSTDPVYLPLVALSVEGQSKPIRIDATAYMRHSKRLRLFDRLSEAGIVVPEQMREPRMWRTRQKETWRAALKNFFA